MQENDLDKFVIVSARNERGVTITESINGRGDRHINHDMNLQKYSIMGDSRVYFTSGPERYRYAELQSCRDYNELFTRCMTLIEDYDDYEVITICGHSPNNHNGIGPCDENRWDDYGRISCECTGYTKPTPLMVIE